ncbi:hypothetical protein ACS0TY_028815 [Phlomoides rotata]
MAAKPLSTELETMILVSRSLIAAQLLFTVEDSIVLAFAQDVQTPLGLQCQKHNQVALPLHTKDVSQHVIFCHLQQGFYFYPEYYYMISLYFCDSVSINLLCFLRISFCRK